MQQRIAFALLALLVAGSVDAASTEAASRYAKAWLQSHKSPTEDQLGELQSANPQAFAIVNALLNKHAHGEIKLSAEDRGPDVFRRMMSQGSHIATSRPQIALPYASAEMEEVSAPVVTNNAQYNPNDRMNSDENAVSKLLSAVASLGGEKGRKIGLLNKKRTKKQEDENPLEQDASLFAKSEPAPAQPIEAVEQSLEQQQVQQEAPRVNSYLKGIDLSGDMPAVVGAVQPRQERPLKLMARSASNSGDFGSSLSTFSFGDENEATPAPKKVEAPKPKPQNAFLKWLGFTKKAPPPVEKPAAPAQPAEKQNFYGQFLS